MELKTGKEAAMIKKVSHIGLAVKDLKEASDFFRENFGFSISEKEDFGELNFSFVPIEGGTDLELLQSTTPDGTIAKFIQKRGEGIHHISFEVDDIQAELDRLKAKGLTLINETPYPNAHEDLVAFIHPKSTYGILVELIQPK
jgi:methylmalonyl-CoA epimerase